MTDNTQPPLLGYLTRHYASLKQYLTRKLGNADLASDALHDTWLRLKDKDEQRQMESPGAYLVRIATNIAVDRQRQQRRTRSSGDIDALLDEMADPAPGPGRQLDARVELDAVMALLAQMPERRRVILIMVHWQDVPQKRVAEQLGISIRTVEYELQRAHSRLDAYLKIDGK
jgi:RNA polymerase sigma-70 factor (ECF subfamily)